MNHKRKSKTSKYKNKMASKRRVRRDTKNTTRSRDGMRANRRNYGEGLAKWQNP